MDAKPGRLILPDDIKPLGQLERQQAAEGLRHTAPLRFAPCDFGDEFVFFNHGVLFSHGGFVDDNDPVGDWLAAQPEPVDVVKQAYRTPLFSGLAALTVDNRVPWDRVLCGVPRVHWDSLLEHLAGICIVDQQAKRVQLVYFAKVEILDPSYVDQYGIMGEAPKIECYVFCLSGNHARHEFVRPASLLARPRLEQFPPTQAMLKLGRELTFGELDGLIHRHNPAHINFLLNYQDAINQNKPGLIS